MKAAVPLLEFRFVFPVDPFGRGGAGPFRGRHALLAGDAPHLRVVETAHDFGHGFGVEHRVGVGEDDDRGMDMLQRTVQRCGFAAAPGVVEHRDPRIGGQQFGRAVGRSVRHPGDVQPPFGVDQRPAVFHFGGDDLLLVVSGDQQRHFGCFGRGGVFRGGAHRLAEFHQHGEQGAVPDVGVDDEQGAGPENDGCGSHGVGRFICGGAAVRFPGRTCIRRG